MRLRSFFHFFPPSLCNARPLFDQVETVVRNAQSFSIRVFDLERLDGLLGDTDALQPGEPPYAVVQMDDVIARRQRGDGLQRGDPVQPSLAPDPVRPGEDLVIGEDEKRVGSRDAETSAQAPDGHVHARGQASPGRVAQDLPHAIELPRAVTQDHDVVSPGDRGPDLIHQKGNAPPNGGGRLEPEPDRRVAGRRFHVHGGQSPDPLFRLSRWQNQRLGRKGMCVPEVLSRLTDLAPQVDTTRPVTSGALEQQHRVIGEELEQATALDRGPRCLEQLRRKRDRQDLRLHQTLGGSLRQEIEPAHGLHSVVPQFDPQRLVGAEREDIHDASPDDVVPQLTNTGRGLESHRLQSSGELRPCESVSHSHLEPETAPATDRRALHEPARCRHDDSGVAFQQGGDGLCPATRNLDVRIVLLVGESLPLRHVAGCVRDPQCLEVREPQLRISWRVRHQHEVSRVCAVERRRKERRAGSGESPHGGKFTGPRPPYVRALTQQRIESLPDHVR